MQAYYKKIKTLQFLLKRWNKLTLKLFNTACISACFNVGNNIKFNRENPFNKKRFGRAKKEVYLIHRSLRNPMAEIKYGNRLTKHSIFTIIQDQFINKIYKVANHTE